MPVEESISVKFKGDVSDLETGAKKGIKSLEDFNVVTEKVSKAAATMVQNAAKAGGSIEANANSIQKLSQAVNAYFKNVNVPTLSVDQITKQIDVLQNKLNSSKASLSITTDERGINKITGEISLLEGELSRLQGQRLVLNTSAIFDQFSQINNSILSVESNIQRVESELGNVRLNLNADPTKVTELTTELTGLKTKLTELNNQKITLQAGEGFNVINQLNNSVSDLQTKIAAQKIKLSLEAPASIKLIEKEIENLEAEAQGLKNISIAIETGGATRSINILSNSIETLRAKAEARKNFVITETDVHKIAVYNKEIQDLENQIDRLQNIGKKGFNGLGDRVDKFGNVLNKLNKQNGAATQSLINLSRVAQDAPFGFIGIANNLNPLLESFQRLKQESGSTGSALKALGTSLIGPAGVGLALGIVSSLLITFGDKLFSSKSAAEKQADALAKAKQALQNYQDSLSDTTKVNLFGLQNAQGELVKLQTLFKAASDANIPLAQRKKIVDELQEQYPKYFKNISDETILAGGATEAYTRLTASILASSRARAAQESIVDLQKQLLTVEQQITDNISQRTALEGKFRQTRKKDRIIFGGTDELGNLVSSVKETDVIQSNINDKLEAGNKLYEDRFQLQKRINSVSALLTDIIVKAPDAILDPGASVKEPKTKTEINFFDKFFSFDPNGRLSEKQRHDVLDAVDSFRKEFGDILAGLDFQASTEEGTLVAAKEWWANFRKGIFKLKPPKIVEDFSFVPEIKPTGGNGIDDFLNGLQQGFEKVNPNNLGLLPDQMERLRITTLAKFEKLFSDVGLKLPDVINKELGNGLKANIKIDAIPTADLDKDLQETLNKLIAFRDNVNKILSNSFQTGFSSLGENLAASLSNGFNALDGVTSSIVDFMGTLVSQIGDALIQYGIVKTGLDQILKAGIAIPGVVAIALGVAAKAAASLIKSSKPKGFAEGGLVFGPTLGLVGEGRGTTRSNPEVIAPLNKLGQFLGGSTNSSGGGELRIRGNDLVLATARNNRKQRRVR